MEDHVMIHDERERLVERFAAGRMTPTEKSELSERATRDERLARLMRAEETITSAVERDRAGILLAGSHQPSARILGSLAASSSPAAGGAVGGLLSAGTILKGIVGVVGLLGLTAGLYFYTPLFVDSTASNAEQTEQTQKMKGSVTNGVDNTNALHNGIASVTTGGSQAMPLLGGATQRLERTREMEITEKPSPRSTKVARLTPNNTKAAQPRAQQPPSETKNRRPEINNPTVPFNIKNRP